MSPLQLFLLIFVSLVVLGVLVTFVWEHYPKDKLKHSSYGSEVSLVDGPLDGETVRLWKRGWISPTSYPQWVGEEPPDVLTFYVKRTFFKDQTWAATKRTDAYLMTSEAPDYVEVEYVYGNHYVGLQLQRWCYKFVNAWDLRVVKCAQHGLHIVRGHVANWRPPTVRPCALDDLAHAEDYVEPDRSGIFASGPYVSELPTEKSVKEIAEENGL